MIKNRRIEANLSQHTLAGKIGMDRRTYQRKEKEEGSFTIDEMNKLGKVLGFKLYLINGLHELNLSQIGDEIKAK